jgi:hypothetical protein
MKSNLHPVFQSLGSKGGCLNQLAKCPESSLIPGGTVDISDYGIYILTWYSGVY